MENTNRLGTLSITPTVARQTPHTEFGTVLASAAREVVKTGAGVVASLVPGGPAVSAAVASLGAVVSTGVSSTRGAPLVKGAVAVSGGGASGVTAGGSTAVGTTGQGDQWDLLAAQKAMQEDGAKMNLAYMDLQNQMQAESRAQNAISNIMKVRHDSAKAAINNIR